MFTTLQAPPECTISDSASQHPNDQSGITLQTLIVTAVLVLMAVAAGVIIIAIADNATEDLEDQASDLEGACEPWEIHDPVMEARGIGGPNGYGGVESSAIGCLRACYIVLTQSFFLDNPNPVVRASAETSTPYPPGTGVPVGYRTLARAGEAIIFSREVADSLIGVVAGRHFSRDPAPGSQNEINFLPPDSNFIPRVSASQDRCEIYNPETGKVNDYIPQCTYHAPTSSNLCPTS